MKVSFYSVCCPLNGVSKQYSIMARETGSNRYFQLVYLQRPKWIKDNDAWEKIVNSIRLELPKDYEVK